MKKIVLTLVAFLVANALDNNPFATSMNSVPPHEVRFVNRNNNATTYSVTHASSPDGTSFDTVAGNIVVRNISECTNSTGNIVLTTEVRIDSSTFTLSQEIIPNCRNVFIVTYNADGTIDSNIRVGHIPDTARTHNHR